MSKLSDAEINAIAAKVVADLKAQKELDAIELHRQVSRLEDDLRKAQAEIGRLTENNGYLQNFNNQLLASRNGQSSYVAPASAPAYGAPYGTPYLTPGQLPATTYPAPTPPQVVAPVPVTPAV